MNRIGTSIDDITERIAAIRASITPERQAEIDAEIAAERALEARRKVVAVGMPSISSARRRQGAEPRAPLGRERLGRLAAQPRRDGRFGRGQDRGRMRHPRRIGAYMPRRVALCRFATFGDVLRSVRDTYGAEGSESRALAQWAGCRILCLDDIGKEQADRRRAREALRAARRALPLGQADAFHDAVPIPEGIGASAHGERRRQAHGAGDRAPRVRRRGLPGGSSAMLGAK